MGILQKLSFAEQIGTFLAVVALVVAIITCISAIFIPEIRETLGLEDESTEVAKSADTPTAVFTHTYTPSQTPTSPQVETPTHTSTFDPSSTNTPIHTSTATDYPTTTPTPTFTPSLTSSTTPTETYTPTNIPPTLTPTLKINTPVPTTQSNTSGGYPCTGQIVDSNASTLNVVRANPSRTAPLVRAVTPNLTVTLVEERNADGQRWYKITYGDSQSSGWIQIDYVVKSANCP